MRIPLDRQSDVPLYRQIENYLRQYILGGKLAPETRLPASRELAQELGTSRITVQNAYAELESEGLIYTREGSGTYVAPPVTPTTRPDDTAVTWPLWQQELLTVETGDPELVWAARPSPTPHPHPISFTGVGDPHQFPVNDLFKSLKQIIQEEGVMALAYGDMSGGYAPLRETVAHILASQGIQAYPANVLITSGSQQALALVCHVLLQPGDVILVEKPTYNFALELFRALNLKIVGIPIDAQGMQVEMVEYLLQKYHPRLIYTIPNFQNPSGMCLSGPRRRQLAALADQYNVPVLEDDFVGDLRYDGRTLPAIKALAPHGQVIYVGTFSKMLMPGLRVGFLVAAGPVFSRLVAYKRAHDLTTSAFMQRALDRYVTVGRYQTHLRRSCRLYRQRRDAMLTAVARHLPADIQVNPPEGGLFVWLRLPENISSLQLLPLARAEGVDFAPGTRFFPDYVEGEPYLRLNFAIQTPEAIDEGIRRLAIAWQRLGGDQRLGGR